MRQLTATDAAFLNVESARMPMHLTTLLIFDQSDVPGGHVTFKQILERVEARASLLPTYRERLKRVPLELGYPWWIDDGKVDVEFHVRHVALPKPGDWRQLCIQTARIASRKLDRSRPLWEMTIIEGLDHVDPYPPGSFAMVLKNHHAAVDGASGMQMLAALLDHEPDAATSTVSPVNADRAPGAAGLVVRAVGSMARQQIDMTKAIAGGIPAIANLIKQLPGQLTQSDKGLSRAPETRFGGRVSAHRVFDGLPVALDDLRAVKAAVPNATVNDAALSIVGGALRSYLDAHGELPDSSLTAAVPISIRAPGDTTAGNQVTAMVVPLHSDVEDPLERLAAIHDSAVASKKLSEAVEATHLTEAAANMPAGLVTVGTRLASQLGMNRQTRRLINTTVTNVPGSREPLYSCGALLVGHYGLAPVLDGGGLIHSLMGVRDTLFLSFTSCREMLPDPGFYRECIESSVKAHVQAAAG